MRITPAGQVHDDAEVANAIEALLSGHWASGKFADEFSKRLAQYLGVRYSVLCNSGSSANLLAVSALTSPLLGDRRLRHGDYVVVPAVCFPTTLAPVLQCGLIPIFVDVNKSTGNMTPESLRACLEFRPRLVIISHILGNPHHLEAFGEICDEYGMWLIEDNCDALGSSFNGKRTGSFGHLSTQSFYPAHHISTGEGGAVSTSDPLLKRILESLRDWGRDCWCEPGKDNTCGKRFKQEFETLPEGYDHKYTYTHVGYNLKLTDIQAAIGCAQMDKLDGFVEARRHNHSMLRNLLADFSGLLDFHEELPGAKASWFGFLITLKSQGYFTRSQLIEHLEGKGIMTRMLFGGNITRQPGYQHISAIKRGMLDNANYLMENSFWIGCWPGLKPTDLIYIRDTIEEFINP